MADWWQQLVSVGMAAPMESATKRHETLAAQCASLHGVVERKRLLAKEALDGLVQSKTEGLSALAKMRRISRNIGIRERSFSETSPDETLPAAPVAAVERTLHAGETAMVLAKGGLGGVSAGIGAWGLVASFGSASTGTAISSLSGIAATNATLAWFGGGSLAAGGLGIAGGMAVVGGIVAVPALLVTAVGLRAAATKKIADIEKASLKLVERIDELKTYEHIAHLAYQRIGELQAVTAKARTTFELEFDRTWARLHPGAWFGRAWRWVRRLLFGNAYSARQMVLIRDLFRVAGAFASILDQKVFDCEEAVTEGDP